MREEIEMQLGQLASHPIRRKNAWAWQCSAEMPIRAAPPRHLLEASAQKKARHGELARSRDEARAAGEYDGAISAEHKRGLVLGYYIERRESGAIGAFQAKTREEADRVLEETIAKIAAKQAIERAQNGLEGN